MSKTPRTDALINEGADSQNQYITKFIALSKELELELAELQAFKDQTLKAYVNHDPNPYKG